MHHYFVLDLWHYTSCFFVNYSLRLKLTLLLLFLSILVNDLKVKFVKATETNTTSISVSWINPSSNKAVDRKTVYWYGTDSGSKNVANSEQTTVIDGLTPGGFYYINVTSFDDNSRHGTQKAMSDPIFITTSKSNTDTQTFNTYSIYWAICNATQNIKLSKQ